MLNSSSYNKSWKKKKEEIFWIFRLATWPDTGPCHGQQNLNSFWRFIASEEGRERVFHPLFRTIIDFSPRDPFISSFGIWISGFSPIRSIFFRSVWRSFKLSIKHTALLLLGEYFLLTKLYFLLPLSIVLILLAKRDTSLLLLLVFFFPIQRRINEGVLTGL